MELTVKQVPALPSLAWIAVVRADKQETRVLHGPLVETAKEFFIEGAWDGDFPSGDFGITDCVFGSGGIAGERSMTFVSSGSTTDYLYYRSHQDTVVVANSLPLLLAHAGDQLDPGFAEYGEINRSIVRGVGRYCRELPTRHGRVVRLVFRNLRVTVEGVEEVDKRMPPPFPTFEAYFDYVRNRYAALVANARDRRRVLPMSILSTQSRGYDTTALNALAAEFGVDEAFTVAQGKAAGAFVDGERGEPPNDDGSEICAVLGIPCMSIDRRSFERAFDDEYLYYATLDQNADVNLREITHRVSGAAVLLTGTLGEIWYPRSSFEAFDPLRDDALQRGDLGGHGLTEVRLTSGFVHLPIPYIGARCRRDILAITESSAMDQWRLGTAYDRPIPRRMAEEAGVPREMFGHKKIATAVEFPPPPAPYERALRAEYFAFLVRHGLLASWQLPLFPLIHRINSILWFAGEGRHRWMHYAQRAISKIIRRNFRFALRWRHLNGRLFCFCVNKRADDYGRALAQTMADVVEGAAAKVT
jgi:hypothetical protein